MRLRSFVSPIYEFTVLCFFLGASFGLLPPAFKKASFRVGWNRIISVAACSSRIIWDWKFLWVFSKFENPGSVFWLERIILHIVGLQRCFECVARWAVKCTQEASLFKIFNIRERERVCEPRRGAEGERETPKRAARSARSPPWGSTPRPWDHDGAKIRRGGAPPTTPPGGPRPAFVQADSGFLSEAALSTCSSGSGRTFSVKGRRKILYALWGQGLCRPRDSAIAARKQPQTRPKPTAWLCPDKTLFAETGRGPDVTRGPRRVQPCPPGTRRSDRTQTTLCPLGPQEQVF